MRKTTNIKYSTEIFDYCTLIPRNARKRYDLLLADDIVGSLIWLVKDGSMAVAEIGDKKVVYKYHPAETERVIISELSSEREIGYIDISWNSRGFFRFNDSKFLKWTQKDENLSMNWEIRDENDELYFEFSNNGNLQNQEGKTGFTSEGANFKYAPETMFAAWFVILSENFNVAPADQELSLV